MRINQILLALTLSLVAGNAAAQQVTVSVNEDISYEGSTIGRVDSLRLSSGRITLSALFFPGLFAALDSTMKAKGDLERDHWSRRIYWVGNTRPVSGVGVREDHLRLETRIRYEQWTKVDLLFSELKTRLFQDTKTVVWLFTIPASELWNVAVVARVLNIRNFPNWLESVFDLRATESLALPLPVNCGSCNCEDFAKKAGAKISDLGFVRREDNSIAVDLSFTIEQDVDVSECWSI